MRRASRDGIRETLNNQKQYFSRGSWLQKGNRYKNKTVFFLGKDLGSPRTVNQKHLAQYISTSAPLHCADAWTYFGRAIGAVLKGDANTARHLGYYAELRAALSILSSEGVGVFASSNFAVPAKWNSILINKKTTHKMAWLALEHWSGLQKSLEVVAKMISPGGIEIERWLQAFSPGITFFPFGYNLIKSWGLDLKRLSRDRDARNEVSYRPSGLNKVSAISTKKAAMFVNQLWQICQPVGASRFELIDMQLLRMTLLRAFRSSPSGSKYKDIIEETVEQVNPSGLNKSEWVKFLSNQSDKTTHPVLLNAQREDEHLSSEHHIQVVSRAFLLLRIATGLSKQLFHEAQIDHKDLKFWWAPFGKEKGLWKSGSEPANFTDLWTDVEDLFSVWDPKSMATNTALADLNLPTHVNMNILETFERVGLWGLGI